MDKNTIKLGLFLMLVAALAALALASINNLTSPIIAANEKAAMDASMSEVYNQADSFVDIFEDYDTSSTPSIVGLQSARSNGNPAGVIYIVESKGYGGIIRIMVAFDIKERVITGVRILSQTETPGLGANAIQPWFTERFDNAATDKELIVVKTESSLNHEIQAITAATITSKAVTAGINDARSHFAEIF